MTTKTDRICEIQGMICRAELAVSIMDERIGRLMSQRVTLCGRNRETWVVIRRASLSTDIDSPILCAKCRDALLR